MGLLFRTLEPGEKTVDEDVFTDTGLVLRKLEDSTSDWDEWQEIKKTADEPFEISEDEKKEYNRCFIQAALKSSPELLDEIVGANTSVISFMGIIAYEINSCWWTGLMFTKGLQDLSGRYFAWKAKRKWKLFLSNISTGKDLDIPVTVNQ